MGLPDTLKAKNLFENRKKLINKAFSEFDAKNNDKVLNFDEVLKTLKKMLVRIGNQLLKKILRLIKLFQ